jgi:hypothetical protein
MVVHSKDRLTPTFRKRRGSIIHDPLKARNSCRFVALLMLMLMLMMTPA